ncbi:MAG: hypothetical protein AAGH42_05125 [Pseudomonadota bacterium]
MFFKLIKRVLFSFLALCLFSASALAESVRVPANTRVYVVLKEDVISKRKKFPEGKTVRAAVWRDVMINGYRVIDAGTPVLVKVDEIKSRKIAGIKGKISLGAYETTTTAGLPIQLDGGYFKKGKGRIALSATLAAVVFLPFIFIPGKRAKLPSGTVFDAYVDQSTIVELASERSVRSINLGGLVRNGFSADVDYDALEGVAKPDVFTLLLTGSINESNEMAVTSVNGNQIKAIDVEVSSLVAEEGAASAIGTVKIEKLSKHFARGINRFTVTNTAVDGTAMEDEVVLDIQF